MTYEESFKLLSCWLRCTETDNTLCVSKESCDDCKYDYDSEKIGGALHMTIEALEKCMDAESTFEFCDDCKEYDKENHCCHRWTKVIQRTCEEHKAYYEVELLDKIERIVYDHTDSDNYNLIMRGIYELYDLDWGDEE